VSSSPAFFTSPATMPRNGVIDVEFSKPLDPATVTAANVQVRGTNNVTVLPSSLSLRNGNRVVRITPSAVLPDNGSPANNYIYLFFSSGLRDTENIPFVASNPYVYYTTATDGVPPAVTAFAPVNGATGVGTTALIRIDFNEALNRTSVTPGTVSLASSGNPIPYSLQFSTNNASLTLIPNVPLPANAAVTVTVNGVEDAAANPLAPPVAFTFNTSQNPDTVGPVLLRSNFVANQTNVPVNSVFTFEFNEPIDPRSVNGTSFQISDNVVGLVPSTLSLSSDLRTVTLMPNAPLAIGRGHSVSGSVVDLAGNSSSPVNLSFTAALAPDSIGPVVVATNPPDGAVNEPINAQVQVLFDEPVQSTSLSSVTLFTNGQPVPISQRTLTNGNRLLSLVPMMPLPSSAAFTLTITEVRDTSGNLMSGTVTRNFTTRAGADLIAPAAPVSSLANNTNVPTNVVFRLSFSEPVNSAAFAFAPASLIDSNTGRPTPLSRSLAPDRLSVVLTPLQALVPGTAYSFSFSGASDSAGNVMPSNFVGFTTGSGPDNNAPAVTSISPANGATGIPLNARITLTFNRPLQFSTVNSASVQLNPPAAGTAFLSFSGTTITFTPAANLTANTVYSVTTSGLAGVNGLAASPFAATFTTSALTVTGNGVVSNVTPVNGASGVPVNSTVTVTFNRDVNPATVNADTMPLLAGPSDRVLAATYSFPAANQVLITPVSPLPGNTLIKVRVSFSSTPQDLAGNSFSFSQTQFTTANTPDATPPSVTSISPADGATGVGRSNSIVVTFSESINPANIQTFFKVFRGPNQSSLSTSVSTDNRTVFLATPFWTPGETVSVLIDGIADIQGNVMAPFRSAFTVASDLPASGPTVTATRPVNGASGVGLNAPITAYFNRPIAPSSINSSSFVVSQNGVPVAGTLAVGGSDRVATFTPSAPWIGGSRVDAFFTSLITDTTGLALSPSTISVAVGPDPATAPLAIVSNSLPLNTSIFNPPVVPNLPIVEARFNRALNPATVNSTNVQLRGINNATVISTTLTLVNGDTIRMVPNAPLPDNGSLGQNYAYIFYGTGLTDTNGVALSTPSNPYFYYGGALSDGSAPLVTGLVPGTGLAGVGTNLTVGVSFSEPINPVSLTGTSVAITANGNPAPATIAIDSLSRNLTVTPLAPLPANANIVVTING
ncbi:MAG TPA: hypothetical protein DEH78_26935, partial [Solibacterales bacterium]|nr:hypothetical protein [Bryobacterales bacterium]